MQNDKPIIIIKKVKDAHAGHHGGAWKVAYADFVTAMMAFFLVMWILGLNQDTRKAIAAYFNDPSGMMKGHAGGKIPTLTSRDSTTGKPSIMPSRAALAKAKEEQEQIKKAENDIRRAISKDPRFKGLEKFVDVTVTRDGLRIELLEARESLFFHTGSATLEPKTTELLALIGQKLNGLDNNIIIEGHTDARPYAGGLAGYSNWELSSDRANSARRALVTTTRENQIAEVRGYADSRLRTPSDPTHFSNRRISILVAYSHQAEGVRMQEVGPDNLGDVAPQSPSISAEGEAKSGGR
jgi:chemotaxis protein MotB